MNQMDRARLDVILKLANELMNASPQVHNHITNADVVEAILEDLHLFALGTSPRSLVALCRQDEILREAYTTHHGVKEGPDENASTPAIIRLPSL